jgi:hypothetical protein
LATFGAVCCLYTLIHLPQDEQRLVIDRIARRLKPGGLFLATVGHTPWTGEQANWLGGSTPMRWSPPDETTYRAWIESAGMTVLDQQFIPDGPSGHTLVITTAAQRGSNDPSSSPPQHPLMPLRGTSDLPMRVRSVGSTAATQTLFGRVCCR